MRQLPAHALVYLIICYCAGLLALGWLVFSDRPQLRVEDVALGAGLAVAAAVCQVLVVERASTSGQRSDHLTLSPLFAALLLLPRPMLALVVVFTFIPEWYLRRRSWFGQIFNISVYLCAAVLARFCFMRVTGDDRLQNSPVFASMSALGILLPIPIFLATQSLMLAWVLKLARGQSFRTSGLFTRDSQLLEVALVCMGLSFAVCWVINPIFGLLVVPPLVLIFQALHVPNLKEEAATDPKTGLANMRHFNDMLARDLERVARSGQPLSLLMCDLDYLRNINNTYGHQAGDIVLLGIAEIIRRAIRGSDVAARFGGEEFVVMLADTDPADALRVAERIRSQLEATRFDLGSAGGPIGATISIGVASFPRDGRSIDGLMREADLAVYQAKREGRNRVVAAGRISRELAGDWAREHLMPPVVAPTVPTMEPPRPLWGFINQATRASINAELRTARAGSRPDGGTSGKRAAGPNGASRRSDPSPKILAFIALIVVAGLLGLGNSLTFTNVPWWSLALFASLTVLSEQFAADLSSSGRVSVSIVAILAAAFLYAELGIAATALAAAITIAVKARSPLHRMLFNLGMVLLSAEGAHWFFETLVGAPVVRASLAAMILPAIGAGLIYHALNQLLLCSIRGLAERRRAWQIWQAEYRWLWPHYAVLGALALIVARGYVDYGVIGVVALMAPVAMMHLSIKQYMERTKVYVSELQRVNNQLTDSYESTLQALTRALDTRDEETEAHSQRVTRYTELIAKRLGVSTAELNDMKRGALLHDIGKIGVPDAILLKPGKLTPEEQVLMHKHPEIGYGMITHIPFLAAASQVVLHHHEAYDGSGYPSGLSGANIPLGARIFAIADTFDAMTSDRPYRKALSLRAARAEIERCRGTQFDPGIVDTFRAIPDAELLAIREGLGQLPEEAVIRAAGNLVLMPG